ncbi:MAG: GspMb/PilO family protein [Sedimentisphaerales bacterium]|nr:GspMb/PilO family protein [Sedimentisphaerales bacterium]
MNFIKVHKKYLIASGVIWSACFVIFLLAYMFIVRPQKNAKRLVESRLAEKQQVYESALRAAQEETKIRLNEQIESLQNRLKDFVVEFGDSANLTFDLSQIAEEKKVASFGSKAKTNRGITREKDEYKYIHENQINISFTGDWNQFATFLNSLERHRPVIFVDKFTIARAGQDESVFRVNLNVAALVRKQQDGETADKNTGQVYGKKI